MCEKRSDERVAAANQRVAAGNQGVAAGDPRVAVRRQWRLRQRARGNQRVAACAPAREMQVAAAVLHLLPLQ